MSSPPPIPPEVTPPTPPAVKIGTKNDHPAIKGDIARSEFWLSMISTVGALLSALTAAKPGVGVWVSFGGLVATAAVYAFLRTPISNQKGPGWKTPAFWAALATIVLSISVAITEADIPGIPPGISKVASIVAAALTAAGYTAIRYRSKIR